MTLGESLGGHDTYELAPGVEQEIRQRVQQENQAWEGYDPNAHSAGYVPVDTWIIPDRILTGTELADLRAASGGDFDERTAQAAAQWGDDRAVRVLQDRLDADPVSVLFDASIEVEAYKAALDEELAFRY